MEKTEKKSIDGWSLIQSFFMLIITLAVTFAANQISHLNHSINDLNKSMSAALTDITNQKEKIGQTYIELKQLDGRVRDLEIKTK